MKINHLLTTAVCLSAFSLPINAQNCAELFKKANSLRANGKWSEAIVYYQKAMACDPYLKADCKKYIKLCNGYIRDGIHDKNRLTVSANTITIPYQGGDQEINVFTGRKWEVEGNTDWCKTDDTNAKKLVVQCRETNNNTRDKITNLKIKSGDMMQIIKVIQQGRPEYLEVGANNISFPAKGTEENISIASNANWKVTSSPSWCKIERREDGIHIIVAKNERVMERTDNIIIESPSKTVVVKVYQGAGDEKLTPSQNDLLFSADGDTHIVKIYTDASNWFISDYPAWISKVEKVDDNSLRIECGKNLPNGETRTGSVQIRTDRQTAGITVTQSPRMAQDLIFPDSKLVGGRNLSFGVSASYYMPFISTSAGGDYVGSVVDYGLGTNAENASYKSATGFSFGVFADMRLYKNIFLQAGVNFTQVKYENTFNKPITLKTPLSVYQYLKGEVQNNYTEEYTHQMIEVPILASYRFKINEVSHVQFNVGPVLNFGLSAKMKISGNSDSESLTLYNYKNQVIENGYVKHTSVNSEFDLYKNIFNWTETYTEGNDLDAEHTDEFMSSPLKKFNYGLRVGIAYEWAGLSLGLSYTQMLSNMADKNYWENDRWTMLNNSDTTMKGYKHRINNLEIKLAYTLRYIKSKK